MLGRKWFIGEIKFIIHQFLPQILPFQHHHYFYSFHAIFFLFYAKLLILNHDYLISQSLPVFIHFFKSFLSLFKLAQKKKLFMKRMSSDRLISLIQNQYSSVVPMISDLCYVYLVSCTYNLIDYRHTTLSKSKRQ